MEQLTFEEAKQKVAEKHDCKNWDELKVIAFQNYQIYEIMDKAAELWQQSNVERIKELEYGVKSIIKVYEELDYEDYEMRVEIENAKQLLK